MNMNWKIVKIVGAFIAIIATISLAISVILPQSYNGADLNFEIDDGAIVITNPSEQSIPVQFIGTGTRGFRVSSDIEEVSGNSTREESGNNTTQLFEFELPPGTSEISVTRGTNVTFVATSPVELEANVYPMTADSSRNAIIATLVVILGLLFYASNVVEHRWIRILTGGEPQPESTQSTPSTDSGQGQAARAFGDNRTYRP